MPYYVCKGAKLKCSMGSDQSALEVVHLEKPVRICGHNMAGIMDHKPMMNIKPFGQCKSLANPVVASATAANYGRFQEMPCVPNTTSPWLNGKMNFLVKGQPALLDCSKCLCLWAGVIEITDAGQKLMSCGIGGPASQETGAGAAGADSAAAVSSGNGLASQGTGASLAAAGNAAPLGIAASGSQASQGAGAAAASGGRLLIRKVESETEGEASPGDVVTYKVSAFSIDGSDYSTKVSRLSADDKKRIRWAVKASGGIAELKGRNGDSIDLEIRPDWAGKEIAVMACVEGFNENVCQRTRVGKAGAGGSVKTSVAEVNGDKEAYPGQKVKYRVSKYNKGEASNEERKNVRWAVGVGDKPPEALHDEKGREMKGQEAEIEMKKEWAGKTIAVMAYLKEPQKEASRETKVAKFPILIAQSKHKPGMDEKGIDVAEDMRCGDMTKDEILKMFTRGSLEGIYNGPAHKKSIVS